MSELFSPEWMRAYQAAWNADVALVNALAKIEFNSVIGYGFPDEPQPRGVLTVVQGQVMTAEKYTGQSLNWDLRATPQQWQRWMQQGIDMMGLSLAYLTGKLKFKVGDYQAMIKNPLMAVPFVRSFAVMHQCEPCKQLAL